jgi:DNA-binding MarR family transcriptional regulator
MLKKKVIMKEYKVLYKIHTIDNMILRNIGIKEKNKEIINKSLTPTQMQIIEYILEHKEKDIYQKDLEKVLNLRRATVSGVLQTMEKNNLIERTIDEKDTRTKKIILNKETKNIFHSRMNKVKSLEKNIVKNIEKDDLDIFFKVILQIEDNINLELEKKEG